MDSLEITAALAPNAIPNTSQSKGFSGDDPFVVPMADEMLRSTGQYGRWTAIRQKDPTRAAEIAQLVLQRHAYLEGTAPATEAGRQHFDSLTDKLAAEGIHLYKSHQFSKPIFPAEVAKEPATLPLETDPVTRCCEGKDCYEFVAGVLESNGIPYYGRGGVGYALMEMARSDGENPYAYFTGEGVTELLCEQPVTKHVPQVKASSLDELWSELEPHLTDGAILSFSSQRFGHTGVVEQVDGRWVYVNSSGSMDDKSSYQVLEEDLKTELAGRLERARRDRTFLDITLGTVSRELAGRFGAGRSVRV